MATEAVLSIKWRRNVYFLFFFQIITYEDYEIILKQLFTSPIYFRQDGGLAILLMLPNFSLAESWSWTYYAADWLSKIETFEVQVIVLSTKADKYILGKMAASQHRYNASQFFFSKIILKLNNLIFLVFLTIVIFRARLNITPNFWLANNDI
jgi:hypothetical protein